MFHCGDGMGEYVPWLDTIQAAQVQATQTMASGDLAVPRGAVLGPSEVRNRIESNRMNCTNVLRN